MLAHDKKLHLIVGFAIGLLSRLAGAPLGSGLGLAALAGLGKEAYDWTANKLAEKKGLPPPHGVEAADFAATSAGGLAGEALAEVLIFLGRTGA